MYTQRNSLSSANEEKSKETYFLPIKYGSNIISTRPMQYDMTWCNALYTDTVLNCMMQYFYGRKLNLAQDRIQLVHIWCKNTKNSSGIQIFTM